MGNAAPRLSVIVPHLNEPGDLRHCLEALRAQSGDGIDFEVIVVDNGSRLPPSDICAAFNGTRLEIEPTPGPGPARNRGAQVARSPLLAFIDADCVAQPGWVRAAVEYMEAHPDVDFAGGDIRISCAVPGRMTSIEAYESVFSYRAEYYIRHRGFAATGNMVVRAGVFHAVGPFGGITTMEDTEWGQRATARGCRAGFISAACVCTPSCKSFAELTRRWDRHIAHEFREVGRGSLAIGAWAAKGLAVALSPPREIGRIWRSRRLRGVAQRWAAMKCLTRIRLYRAGKMFSLCFGQDAAALVVAWNREKT